MSKYKKNLPPGTTIEVQVAILIPGEIYPLVGTSKITGEEDKPLSRKEIGDAIQRAGYEIYHQLLRSNS